MNDIEMELTMTFLLCGEQSTSCTNRDGVEDAAVNVKDDGIDVNIPAEFMRNDTQSIEVDNTGINIYLLQGTAQIV